MKNLLFLYFIKYKLEIKFNKIINTNNIIV